MIPLFPFAGRYIVGPNGAIAALWQPWHWFEVTNGALPPGGATKRSHVSFGSRTTCCGATGPNARKVWRNDGLGATTGASGAASVGPACAWLSAGAITGGAARQLSSTRNVSGSPGNPSTLVSDANVSSFSAEAWHRVQ